MVVAMANLVNRSYSKLIALKRGEAGVLLTPFDWLRVSGEMGALMLSSSNHLSRAAGG